jgi:GT2 family glycosyltransferase
MDVSIIIVNYNTRELLRNCLVSVFEQTKDINFEVIVSDNASTDGTIEMLNIQFPQVILIENKANLGFGAANNRGLDMAKGEYIFYLNSDTVLLNNAVKMFFDFWENYYDKNRLGAIGCNLVDENYKITHSYGDFPNFSKDIKALLHINVSLFIKSIFRLCKYDYQYLRSSQRSLKKHTDRVDYITGADIFLRNDSTGRFDERFFLYFEEVELQYRMSLEEKARLLIDGPIIQHFGGGSNSIKDDFDMYSSFSVVNFMISRILYYIITKKKRGLNIIKLLTISILCNPFFILKTYKYIVRIFYLY